MSSSTETPPEQDPFENSPLTPNLLGMAIGIMDIVVFTMVGYTVFDDLLLGAIAGLLVGTGAGLFVPVIFAGSAAEGGFAELETDTDRHPFRSFHRLAAGMSLGAGGLSYFSVLFAEEAVTIALPVGLLVAAVGYVLLAFALPNATV